DKTGTLTRNRMAVVAFSADGDSGEAAQLDGSRPGHRLFLEALALCNDASLGPPDSSCEDPAPVGDPTEVALLEVADANGVCREDLVAAAPRIGELPFDSTRKMMSTVHARGGGRIVMVKGAADSLLGRCDRVLVGGRELPLDAGRAGSILAEADEMAGRALRVLGAAYRRLEPAEEARGEGLERGLVFLGIVGMIDPPRLEVRESVAACRASGIGVAMITGDHKATALAIAMELGIATGESEAISGSEIDALGDEEFAARAKGTRVFARVSPEHKVRIVKAFRAAGHVVSMTGDGVNDAPSLKAADIGVAMGITGTDVAKGASDMVLADDNFRTIVRAIEEGRNIYNNIRKAILYLLSCNAGEIVAVFSAVLVAAPIPLLPIHILWVNLVTDTFPALALGMDPGDPAIIRERPRDPKESLFSRGGGVFIALNGLLVGCLTIAAFWLGMGRAPQGVEPLQYARTMAFAVLSLSQLFHAFNLRHARSSLFSVGVLGNPWLAGAFILGAFLQVVVIALPPLAAFFRVQSLDPGSWAIAAGLSASTVLANEAAKLGSRLFGGRGRAGTGREGERGLAESR
ncbi:MAG TPA: cation-transporting P-type ATPase, partial [Rectinemataceae bacterium]|nr:cation-transporting P-type ATPase [Rectinemataceae bacterium]